MSKLIGFCLLAAIGSLLAVSSVRADETNFGAFRLPENPDYTILDSAIDSVRFTLNKTLKENEHGHLVSISSFVNPQGEVMGWHDFGNLEGPGWAANAVGGAYEIYQLGGYLRKPDWQAKRLSARAIRDLTVPSGIPSTPATSRNLSPS